MARLAVSLVGAAIGNAILPGIGGQIGFALGGLAANALFAEDIKLQGPRINDAAVTTSAYGQVLPKVWGVFPVAGNIIDASPVREVATTTTSSGKGGPDTSQTTYTYFGDLAVAVHDGEIAGILQIRANGQLIFDASPDAQIVRPDWLKFKLYNGSETQNPDPTFEALHGAGNVSAYRGTAYVVFEDFPFSQFGNNFAVSFEFLIAVSTESGTDLQATQISVTGETTGHHSGVIEPSTGLLVFPTSSTPTQSYGVTAVDPYTREVVWKTAPTGVRGYSSPTLAAKTISTPAGPVGVPGYVAVVNGTVTAAYTFLLIDAVSGVVVDQSPTKASGSSNIVGMVYDWADVRPYPNPFYIKDRGVLNGYDLYYGFDTEVQVTPPGAWKISTVIKSNGEGKLLVSLQDADTSPASYAVSILDSTTLSWTDPLTLDEPLAVTYGEDSWWILTADNPGIIKHVSNAGALLATVDLDSDYGIDDTIVNGSSTSANDGLYYEPTTAGLFFQGVGTKLYEINTADLSVAPAEYSIATSYNFTLFHTQSARAWYVGSGTVNAYSANILAASGQVAALSDVVSDLSINGTELASGDIAVTSLASIDVRGFGITSAMARRNAISALQVAYMFDYVNRGGTLTAVLRGQSATETLTEDDIGAHIAGSSQPAVWTIQRAPGNALPDQVEITFIDADHNYEPGTQSARRQASTGGTVARLQLPVVLSNDEAAQVADTYLHVAHIESEAYETVAMPSLIDAVRPAEVLSALVDGVTYTFRVTDGSVIDGRMIRLSGKREVSEVFTSYAVGGTPRASGGSVAALGSTIIWPLDIPTLRTEDNTSGVYVAAASFTQGWPGCSVQRSTDGAEWVATQAMTSASAMGSAVNVPTVGQVNAWDSSSTLTVRLISGALASTTRDAPTYAAWGSNGRFEIIAFLSASQNSDGSWAVSGIARGMLDTQAAMGEHAVGDQFIVLSESTLARQAIPSSSIGQTEYLRGVTIGRTAASAIPVQYAFAAEGLEPFAPVRLHAVRDGSDNWDISWARQDRLITRKFWNQVNSEATESYTLKIFNASGTVMRTETITDATSYEYTAANQIADFGIKQSELRFSVAQVGAYTGDGHASTAYVGADFAYVDTIVDDSPLMFYTMDDTSGTTCDNIMGATNDGSYVGSPTLLANGVMSSGQSVDFSGSGQYVEVVHSGLSNGWSRSLEFGFVCDALPASGEMAIIVSGYNNGGTLSETQFITVTINSSGVLIFRAYGYGSIPGPVRMQASGSALSAGTAYHVVINHTSGSGGTAQVYVNGSLYGSASSTGDWNIQPGWLWIGHDGTLATHADFNGRIDNVSFWTATQSAGQIADHYTRSGIS